MTEEPRDPAATELGNLDTSGLDISGPDTPGPEATPEQEASVSALLGLLRDDDIPMPDDVVRRLDAVLAEERRRRPAPTSTGLVGVAAIGDTADSDVDDSSGDGLATVLPMGAASGRTQRDHGWLTWLAGAAAAVVVVGGGVALFGQGGRTSSVTSAAASVAPEAGVGTTTGGGTTAIRSTGIRYSSKTLPTQVSSLLSTVTQKDTVSAAANSPDVPAPLSASAPTAAQSATSSTRSSVNQNATPSAGFANEPSPLTTDTVASCMTNLQLPGVVPLVVDRGTYDNKPADVVVVSTEGNPATVDVYVLHPGCATAEPLVYELATVPRP